MNKEERKKLHKALTHHYLKEQADGDNIANHMERQLERAVDKGYDKVVQSGHQ
jgi:molecular chaperone GrpE (heat shock protein)